MQDAEPRPDPLLDILRALRLTGGVFLEASFASPWCVHSRVEPGDCAGFLPLPRHIIAYHYVCAGELVVQVEGETPVAATRGDIVILPRNDGHHIGSDLRITPLDVNDLFEPGEGRDPARMVYGSADTADTRFFCGFLGHNQIDDPLISALPRVLRLSVTDTSASQWIESSLRFASSQRPATTSTEQGALSPALLGKLAELLFVEAVRQYLRDPQAPGSGWIAGLRDPFVGRALALMHSDGDRQRGPWTAETLAREVGLSRSAFAERFTTLVGDPPMRYLAQWRLRQAARRLAETTDPIARIADEAGYESEAAFHRAFKRVHQMTPAAWRKQQGVTSHRGG
jgi:AraC-like DNA-binding protein